MFPRRTERKLKMKRPRNLLCDQMRFSSQTAWLYSATFGTHSKPASAAVPGMVCTSELSKKAISVSFGAAGFLCKISQRISNGNNVYIILVRSKNQHVTLFVINNAMTNHRLYTGTSRRSYLLLYRNAKSQCKCSLMWQVLKMVFVFILLSFCGSKTRNIETDFARSVFPGFSQDIHV